MTHAHGARSEVTSSRVLGRWDVLAVGLDVIPRSAEEIDLPHREISVMVLVSLVSLVAAMCRCVIVMLTVGSSLPAANLAASDLVVADAMARSTTLPAWFGPLHLRYRTTIGAAATEVV